MFTTIWLLLSWLSLLTTLRPLLLVGLVLRIGVATLTTLATIIAGVALWVAGIILAILASCLTMLEAAMRWRAEGVLAAGRAEVLILRIATAIVLLLLTILLTLLMSTLVVALLRRIATSIVLLLTVLLLLAVVLTAV